MINSEPITLTAMPTKFLSSRISNPMIKTIQMNERFCKYLEMTIIWKIVISRSLTRTRLGDLLPRLIFFGTPQNCRIGDVIFEDDQAKRDQEKECKDHSEQNGGRA